ARARGHSRPQGPPCRSSPGAVTHRHVSLGHHLYLLSGPSRTECRARCHDRKTTRWPRTHTGHGGGTDGSRLECAGAVELPRGSRPVGPTETTWATSYSTTS